MYLFQGVEMGVLEVPLHEVNIKSSLINGNIVISMRPSLPVEGISLILGNDLAGEKVMIDPRVVEKPRDDEKTERLAEKFPGIFPAYVVTRSMGHVIFIWSHTRENISLQLSNQNA